jgi:hypothetical protein
MSSRQWGVTAAGPAGCPTLRCDEQRYREVRSSQYFAALLLALAHHPIGRRITPSLRRRSTWRI